MRHGVCYAIIREFNLNSSTLRHLDRYLEESVERVGRVLPAAAVLQRLAAIDFVEPPRYAIFVQVRIPCDDRCFAAHLNHRLQLAVRIRRVKPSDILLPNFRRPAAVQLDTCRVRRRNATPRPNQASNVDRAFRICAIFIRNQKLLFATIILWHEYLLRSHTKIYHFSFCYQ